MTMTEARAELPEDAPQQVGRGAVRFGLIARGVMFGLLSLLALRLAFGDGSGSADSQGALRTVAGGPLGSVLLISLALGLGVYAAWQAICVKNADGWHDRLAAGARTLVWGALAVTAARYVFSSASGGGNQEESITAALLNWPFGTWIVAGAGLVVIGIGLAFLRKLPQHEHHEDLKPMSQRERKVVSTAAVVGLIGRTIVFVLTGAFLIRAAVTHDPDQGVGLDGALSQVAQEPYGTYVLVAVSIGMAAYAVWCMLRTKYEDIDRSDG